MKGYCKQCTMVIDETESTNGYCHECWNDRLKNPILFSNLSIESQNGLMVDICERIIKLEASIKTNGKHVAMREEYINAGNVLEEVHFAVENIESKINIVQIMLKDMKALFQKGWGVP